MSILTIILLCLLVSSVWNIFFWGHTTGISLLLFAGIVSLLFLWYKKSSLSKAKSTLLIHLGLIFYLSICAFTYRNTIILRTTIPAVFVALGVLAFIGHKGYSFSNFFAVIEGVIKSLAPSVFAGPFAIGGALNSLTKKGTASKTFGKITIGLIISLPFMIIFLCLFTSADPVFEKYLHKVFEFFWRPEVLLRLVVIFFVWVVFSGYISRTRSFDTLESFIDRNNPNQNDEGLIIFVFLLMLNLLFVSFIVIQIGYLFGGKDVIASTDHTYASYVHKGFFEFWAAVILVSFIIVVTDYRLREQKLGTRRFVEIAWIAMIVQTLIIIASGLKRIYAYEEAYGYTYLRILVALFFFWVAGVFILFICKILRDKSLSWLISSSICLAFAFLVFVSTFSLDKYIAAKNVDRYLNDGKDIDIEYLSKMSTDAYGHIERLKTQANSEDIRSAADMILRDMSDQAAEELSFWGSWNLSLSSTQNDAE